MQTERSKEAPNPLVQQFGAILQAFKRRAADLRKRAHYFSWLRTLNYKRQVIKTSDDEFEMMQSELDNMRCAVGKMPDQDSESCGETLMGCQGEFAELCCLFELLKQKVSAQEKEETRQRLMREQEEEEQPRENWRGPE
jgi:hypothetical protein